MALFFGAALMLSCARAPMVVDPPLTVPEHFSDSGTAPLPDQWWLAFEDPALDALIDEALGGNFDLLSAWDRLTQAEAVARQAGASLFPSLNAQAGASRTWNHTEVMRSDGSTGWDTIETDNVSLGLVANWEIDLWGRIRASRTAAALDVLATEEDLRATAIALSGQVAAVWYNLIEQRAQIELLDQQIETNERTLDLITAKFRRGQADATDVLQQRQLVEQRRSERIEVMASVRILEHQLAVLLGRAPRDADFAENPEIIDLPPLPDTAIPATLIQRRPDVRSAERDVMAADQRLGAAIADRYPQISLSLQGTTDAENVRDLFDNWLASLAANLTAPLIDGGRRRAEVDRTRAVVSESLNRYGSTILTALQEVEDALAREAAQAKVIESLDRQLALSTQVLERTRDRYLQGAIDYQFALDRTLTHQSLQRSRLTAMRQLIERRIDLCRALAGGWTMERPAGSQDNTSSSLTLADVPGNE